MTPEQWQLVKSLFEAAMEKDENQRTEFVTGTLSAMTPRSVDQSAAKDWDVLK